MDIKKNKRKIILAIIVLLIVVLMSVILVLSVNLYYNRIDNQSEASNNNQNYTAVLNIGSPTHKVSRYILGANLLNANLTLDPDVTRLLKESRITSLRFPNGCLADYYNFRTGIAKLQYASNGGRNQYNLGTPDEFIRLADEVSAKKLYVIHIEYRYGRGNPCGGIPLYPFSDINDNLDAQQQLERNNRALDILINDAKEIVRLYGEKIDWFQLGNEPWGFWDAEEYYNIMIRFATEMRSVKPDIKLQYVGFPTVMHDTSGNLSEKAQRDVELRARWTEYAKKAKTAMCGNRKCFDFVNDHQYGNFFYNRSEDEYSQIPDQLKQYYYDTVSGYYSNIVLPRKFEYLFSSTVYGNDFPLSITEWNMYCWSPSHGMRLFANTGIQSLYVFLHLMQYAKYNVAQAYYHTTGYYEDSYREGCALFDKNVSPPKLNNIGEIFRFSSDIGDTEFISSSIVSPKVMLTLNSNCVNTHCFRGGVEADVISSFVFRDNNGYFFYVVNLDENRSHNLKINYADNTFKNYKSVYMERWKADNFYTRNLQWTRDTLPIDPNNIIINLPPRSVTKVRFSTESKTPICKLFEVVNENESNLVNTIKPGQTIRIRMIVQNYNSDKAYLFPYNPKNHPNGAKLSAINIDGMTIMNVFTQSGPIGYAYFGTVNGTKLDNNQIEFLFRIHYDQLYQPDQDYDRNTPLDAVVLRGFAERFDVGQLGRIQNPDDCLARINILSGDLLSSLTPTPTSTPTPTPTTIQFQTPINTATFTPTNTVSISPTDTDSSQSNPTLTTTSEPFDSSTPSPTFTPTSTQTSTPTNTPTNTPTHMLTNTQTSTFTNTSINTPNNNFTNTLTPTTSSGANLPNTNNNAYIFYIILILAIGTFFLVYKFYLKRLENI